MATGTTRKLRTTRVGGFALPPGQFSRWMRAVRSREVLVRLGLCFLAAAVMWAATRGWAPPFSYRTGFVPRRDLYVRNEFKVFNENETDKQRDQRRQETPWLYENDPTLIVELRKRLKDRLFRLMESDSYEKVNQTVWREFVPTGDADNMGEDRSKFESLQEALSPDKDLSRFEAAFKRATTSWEVDGLLEKLGHTNQEGSQAVILVYPKGNPTLQRRVEVDRVRIAEVRARYPEQFREELLKSSFSTSQATVLSQLADAWLTQQAKTLPSTLTPNRELSEAEIEKVLKTVEVYDDYTRGKRIAEGGQPLSAEHIRLLRLEHESFLRGFTSLQHLGHSLAVFGMYTALYVLCGFYIANRKPQLIADLRRFSTLLAVVVITVILCWITAADQWRAEIVPLLLFGMTVAIAYEKELALLLSACVSVIVAFSLEQGLAEFVILTSSVAAAILFLGRIRSRTKLIYVALFTGAVVMLTSIGAGTLAGQAFGASNLAVQAVTEQSPTITFVDRLFLGAGWFALCSLLAGLLMTGLLPFIERLFDVQTDISLLELGDAAHPLLQELVRRAPGTYNHSINVASIGEAAAESIGANGLLVRVGAYFHDIGKMLKPQYFVENQGSEGNRHESLAPAMSTLVIIAHVKDGIDLARQHRLPETIVDFIAQHHGTTLVEYFYRRAAKQIENDPDAGEIDEANFRYPGPKPQSKETAVLMLADVVESASRALVDPAPARIESLVHDLAMKRLLDGQFEECGLTLQELHLIEESLVKSLTAVYHGRVKYPEHQTV
jgi:putative nucleotidyltransferase with HDIG domain